MGRKGSRYDRRLLPVAIIFSLLAAGNAIDYFFPTEKNFKKIEGVVTDIDIESFNGRTRRTRAIIYTKFQVQVDHGEKRYYVTDRDGLSAGLANMRVGDRVELRVKKWYQFISYSIVEANIFLARNNGVVVFDILYKCRNANKIFMLVFGAMALLVFVMYLDVVHDISLSNWFQRHVLKKGLPK